MSFPRKFFDKVGKGYGIYYEASAPIVEKDTQFQHLDIFEHPFLGKTLRLDGYLQTSERDEFFYHEALTHAPMLAHPNPERVLIIGGGDGGIADEVLKHSAVKTCVMVDIDADVIELSREHLTKVHGNCFSNPKLEVKAIDGFQYMRDNASQQVSFDVIILDLTDPNESSGALYEQKFYQLCKSNLAKDGIMALHAEYPFFYPTVHGRIIATRKSLFAKVTPFYNYVPGYGTVMGFALCSDTYDKSSALTEGALSRVDSLDKMQYLNRDTLQGLFAIPNYAKTLYEQHFEIISSDEPLKLD